MLPDYVRRLQTVAVVRLVLRLNDGDWLDFAIRDID